MATGIWRLPAAAIKPRARALWDRLLRLGRRAPRRLRLCESLALGERRFVAVIEFERRRFLLGGTASSLVLLAQLGPATEGAETNAASHTERSEAGIWNAGWRC